MNAAVPCLATLALLVLAARDGSAHFLPDSPELRRLLGRFQEDHNVTGKASPGRARRAIQWSDRQAILELHNKLRGEVYPKASDMEYMLWDDGLARSATQWAQECQWEHGPQDLLMSIGQNLAVHMGRHRSPGYHVQAWYDEVKDYTYPYAHECNPWCPDRCSGPMCTHYTQLVWATTNRVGCALHVCPRMDVWGDVWQNAVYLVCNYSPKGNWIGEAPYQHGEPCSKCPPSYGGRCWNKLCYKGESQHSETEDMNEVEQVPVAPATTTAKPAPKPKPKPKPKPVTPKRPSTPRKAPPTKRPSSSKPATTNFLVQNIKCETRVRDKCRGPTCNRYNCPANCMNKKGKVFGTLYYDVQSSICRAAMHYGAIDNNGGLVDITRKDKLPFFIKSTKNGIESFSKFKTGNAFTVSKVQGVSVDCYATVNEICPFGRLLQVNCPRVLCPANCKSQPSYWAPVVGSNFYADSSSICRAAIHAGVIKADGGYVDILSMEKKKSYVGILKNGVQSESKSNLEGGAFRVFTVRQ